MIGNDNNHDKDEDEMMIPSFSIASRDFDHDLTILKKVLHQFEQRTHSEKAYMWGSLLCNCSMILV